MKTEHHPRRSRGSATPSWRSPRPEGRRRHRHGGPAARRLHGVPLGGRRRTTRRSTATSPPSDASRGHRQAGLPGRDLQARQRRQHDHGAEGPGLLDPDRAQRQGPAAAAATAATRSSTTRACRPRSSRSRPTSSGRWRASSPTPSRRSTASTPPSSTSRCRRSRCSPTSRTRPPRRSWSTPGRHDARPRAGPGVVNLVASSIDGLDPGQGHRRGLQRPACSPTGDGLGGVGASTRDQQVDGLPEPDERRRSRRCSTGSSGRATRPSRSPPTSTSTSRSPRRSPTTYSTGSRVRSSKTKNIEKYNGPGAGSPRRRRGRPGRPDGPTTARRPGEPDDSTVREDVGDRGQRRRTPPSSTARPRPAACELLHVGVVLDAAADAQRSTRPRSRT